MTRPQLARSARLPVLALALALVPLAACGGDGGGGTGVDPDLVRFDDLQIALETSLRAFIPSRPANAFLEDALEALSEFGVAFEPASGRERVGASARVGGVQPRLAIPPEIRGSTFAYDDEDERWYIDAPDGEAPDDGIRVTWYRVDGAGFPISSAVLGYLDLTDEDAGGMSRMGVEVVALEGGATTIAHYVIGYARSAGGGAWSEAFEAAGTARDGSNVIDYALGGHGAGDPDGTGESAATVEFEAAEVSYSLRIDESVQTPGDTAREYRIDAIHDAVTTLTMDQSADPGGTSGTGTIRHAGAVVATFTSTGDQRTYARPDGGSFSAVERARLESLFSALTTTGVYVLYEFPLLY